MGALLQDVRYSIRMLAKAPAFTAVVVATLALGIGANTAIFSVINSVLLEPLPFKNPNELVALRETESAPGNFPLDGADYVDWQTQNRTFSGMSMYTFPRGANASGSGEAESAAVVATQANFFDTLGVQPLIGRPFEHGEDVAGKNQVAVLSYGFWERHFGGRRNAVGRVLELNDQPYTVIGVMPKWFNFPAETDIWTPQDMTDKLFQDRGSHWMQAIGRMKPGVSVEQARADLLTISERIDKQYRGNDNSIHSLVFPLKERLTGGSRSALLILLGAVALVLLVACANVANLLLARATTRYREMAVRAALGAGRWRLICQLLTESVLLAGGGAILGLMAAWWAIHAFAAAKTLPIPRANPVELNFTVLLFTIVLTLLIGILFGLAPALHTSALNLSEELKSSATAAGGASGGGRLVRNALVIGEIAICLALLVGAGLLLRSFARLRNADVGVRPENVLTMRVNLPDAKYNNATQTREFLDQLLARIQHTPGVTSAAITTALPLEGGSNGYIKVPGNTNPALEQQLVEVHGVTPNYFKVFGIPLLEGRNFTAGDVQEASDTAAKAEALNKAANGGTPKIPTGMWFPVVINQTMAKTFWPKQNPVGKEFYDHDGGVPYKILGVVGDVKEWGIREKAVPERYFPLSFALQFGPGFYGSIVAKTAVSPGAVLDPIRGDVRDLDSTLAIFHVRTMDEVISDAMQDTSLQTLLLGAFAGLALVLAAVGLYGVMAYLVTQRTHEIGIRVALGAQRADVLGLVIREGMALAGIGIAIGLVGAFALTRLLATLLFGVSARDPLTFGAVPIVLASVAFAACYIPAQRATRVDPLVALRYE